ncbi:hypothetical protein [Marinomonas spartinae]|uniref:hypothetical protein n=1 Tax=Marinomonas spartinae TaxID=1792290 RepID=UPI001112385E|nr:hypothetical protein [Marinomonas spartinae]
MRTSLAAHIAQAFTAVIIAKAVIHCFAAFLDDHLAIVFACACFAGSTRLRESNSKVTIDLC